MVSFIPIKNNLFLALILRVKKFNLCLSRDPKVVSKTWEFIHQMNTVKFQELAPKIW